MSLPVNTTCVMMTLTELKIFMDDRKSMTKTARKSASTEFPTIAKSSK